MWDEVSKAGWVHLYNDRIIESRNATDHKIFISVAPWPGGGQGGHALPLLLRLVGKLSLLSKIVKVVDGGG